MTKNEYDRLKSSGMLWEFFPEASGDFETDVDYVFLENRKKETNQRFVDVFEFGKDEPDDVF